MMKALPKKYHNQIFNADVMNVLRDIPDNSIDLVYADPDYNVGINYAGQKCKLPWDSYIAWYSDIITESMRVNKANWQSIHHQLSEAKCPFAGQMLGRFST